MPIRLYTGVPGAGKTLAMVQDLVEASRKGDRPIYASGIDGLADGLANDLPDPREWNAIVPGMVGTCDCASGIAQALKHEGIAQWLRKDVENPEWRVEYEKGRPHSHVVPDGSIIYVDEAWRAFGHLKEGARSATPDHVLDLAEHRHRGLDFVFTTQLANQLYPFCRGLIGAHVHLVRIFGMAISNRYEWGEMCEDVKSQGQRDKAVHSRWMHPKQFFTAYKSASQNTIKARIPKRFILILLLPILVIGMGVYAYRSIFAKEPTDIAPAKAQAERREAPPAKPTGPDGRDRAPSPKTAEEWAIAMTPVLPGFPFTAPIFDGALKVQARPQVFCIIGGDSSDLLNSSCRCLTEQGTLPGGITDGMCRVIARNGYYDPFKAPDRSRPSVSSRPAVQPATLQAGEAFGVTTPPSQVGPPGGELGQVW